MWQKLKRLQTNLSFSKVSVEEALTRVAKGQTTWPRPMGEPTIQTWVREIGTRLRSQARLISQTETKRPQAAWLRQLWAAGDTEGNMAEADDTGGEDEGAGDESQEDEGQEDERGGGDV